MRRRSRDHRRAIDQGLIQEGAEDGVKAGVKAARSTGATEVRSCNELAAWMSDMSAADSLAAAGTLGILRSVSVMSS